MRRIPAARSTDETRRCAARGLIGSAARRELRPLPGPGNHQLNFVAGRPQFAGVIPPSAQHFKIVYLVYPYLHGQRN